MRKRLFWSGMITAIVMLGLSAFNFYISSSSNTPDEQRTQLLINTEINQSLNVAMIVSLWVAVYYTVFPHGRTQRTLDATLKESAKVTIPEHYLNDPSKLGSIETRSDELTKSLNRNTERVIKERQAQTAEEQEQEKQKG